jgi:hypothetical protein
MISGAGVFFFFLSSPLLVLLLVVLEVLLEDLTASGYTVDHAARIWPVEALCNGNCGVLICQVADGTSH